MAPANHFFYLALGFLTIVFFGLSLFWTGAIWLLFLTFLLAAILLAAFFWPRPAFIALIILRTATDFLTAEEVFRLGAWPVNFTSLAGLGVLVFAAAIFFRLRVWRERPPLLWAWILFLLLALGGLFFSVSTVTSLVEVLRWSSFAALFVLGFSLFRGGGQTTVLIKALIASALIPTLIALIQAFSGLGFFDGERWRVNGTFVHPNMLAFYLLFVITLSIFLFLTLKKEAIEKYLYLFLSLVFVGVLVLTYTRGAWLALLIVLFIVGLLRYRLFLAGSLLLAILAYTLISPFQERINSLVSFSASDSTVWRLDLWRDAWDFSQNNLYLGTGPGTAPLIIGQYRSPILGSTEPHNDYIKLVLETGLVGLAAYLLLIIFLFRYLWLGYRHEKWPRRRLLFLFMLVFSFALYVSSIGDNILKDSSLQWSFWALVGALMYSYTQIRSDKEDMAVE